MLISVRTAIDVDPDARLVGIAAYLQALRMEAIERTVSWVVKLAEGAAQLLGYLAAAGVNVGSWGAPGAELLTDLSRTVQALGRIALAAEAGEIDDPQAAADIAAEVLDIIDEVIDLGGGELPDDVLVALAARVKAGVGLASALAQSLHRVE